MEIASTRFSSPADIAVEIAFGDCALFALSLFECRANMVFLINFQIFLTLPLRGGSQPPSRLQEFDKGLDVGIEVKIEKLRRC